MRSLSGNSSFLWLLIGDFNDIVECYEKRGLHPQPSWLMEGFRQVIEDCHLCDLGMEGYKFTWSRSRGKPNCVEERLDRVLCSHSWSQQFGETKISNLGFFSFDHSALLLEPKQQPQVHKHRRFQFENA